MAQRYCGLSYTGNGAIADRRAGFARERDGEPDAIKWARHRRTSKRPIWPSLVVLMLLALAPAAQSFYYRKQLAPAYFVPPNITKHVMWHNILSGFAVSPSLQHQFGFRIDDVGTIAATGRWLVNRGRAEEWRAMGGESPGFARMSWQPYDHAAGEMVACLVTTRPLAALTAIFFWKPVGFWREVRWISNPAIDYPHAALLHPSQAPEMPVVRSHLLLRRPKIFGPLVVVGLLAGALSMLPVNKQGAQSTWVVALWAFTAAAPILVGYPLLHSMGEALVGVLTAGYFYFSLAAASALRCWSLRNDSFG